MKRSPVTRLPRSRGEPCWTSPSLSSWTLHWVHRCCGQGTRAGCERAVSGCECAPLFHLHCDSAHVSEMLAFTDCTPFHLIEMVYLSCPLSPIS